MSIITSTPPLVSVCIPTFNRGKLLLRAVQKLQSCSYQNLEIIISDNASSDETQSIAEGLCAADTRVKYFRHPQNQGPSKNFNYARAQATGKYFLWHGDDDYLDTHFIELCVGALELDSSLSLASGLGAYHYGDHVTSFWGNVVESHSGSGLLRALHLIFFVEEGSMFCGVYRMASVKNCVMPNCVAGDCVWLSEVLLTGKAKIIPTCVVHRQLGDNTSSSFARIVATLGAPSWHAKYPCIAIPKNLAYFLAFESYEYRNRSLIKRILIWLVVFGTAIAKQAILALVPRIPFGKSLYKRFFLLPN